MTSIEEKTLIDIDPGGLAPLLAERRWFGHKDKILEAVEVVDAAFVHEEDPALVLALVRARFAGGDSATYNMPLLLWRDGRIADAADEAGHLGILGSLMAHADALKGSNGVFEFSGAGLDPMAPPGGQSVRVMGSEQSNTSLVFDEKVVVKLFRKVETGPNPDIELNRMLTSEGYEHTPPQVGEITYVGSLDTGDVGFDVAIAQALAPDAQDGWEYVLNGIRGFYAQVLADPATNLEETVRERSDQLLSALADLGDVTAEMHLVLAREDSDPAFAPEPLGDDDLRALTSSARGRLAKLTTRGIEAFDALVPKLKAQIDALTDLETAGTKARVHGDFHLGQVLWTARGWMLLDFEGEPARSMKERRQKHSPMKDVAGMLRSFGYATTAALFDTCEPGSVEWETLEPWADAWESQAREAFLLAYLGRSHERDLLPTDRGEFGLLLRFFELDKALYELDYEQGHRPDWARIPLRGLGRIAARDRL